MIISPGRNYIFVHIPKTGGTSLAVALEARAKADDILIGDTPKAKRRRNRLKKLNAKGRLWKHARMADIEGLNLPENPFVFTLVRNPWDRLASLYFWSRQQDFDHPMIAAAKALAFDQFLTEPGIVAALKKDSAAAYVNTLDAPNQTTCFVRLEHLATDLHPVERHLGFKLDVPHINQSERPASDLLYTSSTRDHVGDLFAEDIARFGYSPPKLA